MSRARAKAGLPKPMEAGHEAQRVAFHVPKPGASVAIIGVSQMGKSYYAMKWAEWLVAEGERVLSWDPCHEWSRDALQREHRSAGPLLRTVTVSELGQNPDLLRANALSLAVRPDDIYAERKQLAEQFKVFIDMVRRICSGRVHIFIDEVHILVDGGAAEQLEDLAERGGKDGLLPYYLAQRWGHFTPDMRAEVAELYAFLQVKESDLRFLRMDAGSDFVRQVCVLEPHEYRFANLRRVHADALAAVFPQHKEEDDG